MWNEECGVRNEIARFWKGSRDFLLFKFVAKIRFFSK